MSEPRSCIFCGANPLSKEHIWPEWLLRLLPTPSGVETVAQRGTSEPLQVWRSSRAEQTARFVCAPCNNGWMSQIENQAKSRIAALLEQPAVDLPTSSQSDIAIWAVKSAIVFEALRPNREWFYTPEERVSFRELRTVPLRTYVWLSPVISNQTFFCMATDMAETPAQHESETRGYVTTIAFSSIAIQVLTIRPGARIPAGVSITMSLNPAPWDAMTIPIYPAQADAAKWPCKLALQGESGLALLANRWKPPLGIARLTIG